MHQQISAIPRYQEMKNMNSNLLFVQTENKLKFFPYMLQKQNNDVLCIPILK